MFGGAIEFGDFQMLRCQWLKYAILQNCVLCLTGEIINPTPKPGKITEKKLNPALLLIQIAPDIANEEAKKNSFYPNF